MRWFAFAWLLGWSACSSPPPSECQSSTQCNFAAEGTCEPDPEGHRWCRYPDTTCQSGYRWSTEAGDDLASVCVPAVAIAVLSAGDGTGSVVSNPAGIDCGSICIGFFPVGASVRLSATPGPGSQFGSWGGDGATCEGTSCSLVADRNKNVIVTFAKIPNQRLQVARLGNGMGTVTSDPAGIDCADLCAADFAEGSLVKLTAAPGPGSFFDGWGGDAQPCGHNLTCMVTLDSARAASATFTKIPDFSIVISLPGDGTGVVTSDPAGIDCGSVCVATYQQGTSVTLMATASPGSTFVGWSGDGDACGTNTTCNVKVDATRTVAVNFMKIPLYELVLTLTGDATGSVTSQPLGIDCGVQCAKSFQSGTRVTLTASPAPASVFTGWFDDAASCGLSPTCDIDMVASRRVAARMTRQGYPVWLTQIGGDGREWAGSPPVAIAADGSAYVVGTFSSPTLKVGDHTLTRLGAVDIYLAKFSRDTGATVWAKNAGTLSTPTDDRVSVAVDAGSKTLVLVGAFQSNEIPPASAATYVLAAYSADDGSYVWSAGIDTDAEPNGSERVRLGADGFVYATGSWQGTLRLGPEVIGSKGDQDIFVAAYALNGGALSWRYTHGELGATIDISDLSADRNSKVVIVGSHVGPLNGVPQFGQRDGYIMGFRGMTDTPAFTKGVGGDLNDACVQVASLTNGFVVTCQSDLGTDAANRVSLDYGNTTPLGGPSPATYDEVVVARYEFSTIAGAFVWARRFGGLGRQYVHWLDVDPATPSDRILLGGAYSIEGIAFDLDHSLPGTAFENVWIAEMGAETGDVRSRTGLPVSYPSSFVGAVDWTTGRILGSGLFLGDLTFGANTITASGYDTFAVSLVIPGRSN